MIIREMQNDRLKKSERIISYELVVKKNNDGEFGHREQSCE